MPHILGVYFSERDDHVGTGATRKATVTRVHWFVVRLDDERVLLQPLNNEHMPAGLKRVVVQEDFLAGFVPDPEHFTTHLLPVLKGLASKVGEASDSVDMKGLSEHERLVFKALQIDDKDAKVETPAAGRLRIVSDLLATIPDVSVMTFRHQSEVNTRSISLRKEGNYGRAVAYYHKALRLNPTDDHLHFNLARAYWHMGEAAKCAEHLNRALEINPAFPEAEMFLDFVHRKTGAGQPRGAKSANGNGTWATLGGIVIPSMPTTVREAAYGEAQGRLGSARSRGKIGNGRAAGSPSRGDFEISFHDDRRRAPRLTLDTEALCVMLCRGNECPTLVRDISQTGARLEVTLGEAAFDAGDLVMLTERRGLNNLLGSRKAQVVWRSGLQAGVHFATPLATSGGSVESILFPRG